MVLGGQAIAIASWWVLVRFTAERIEAQRGMILPFLLTLGMAAATRHTTLGAAIVEAEPVDGPRMQRRYRRAIGVTLLGVLVAFAGFSL